MGQFPVALVSLGAVFLAAGTASGECHLTDRAPGAPIPLRAEAWEFPSLTKFACNRDYPMDVNKSANVCTPNRFVDEPTCQKIRQTFAVAAEKLHGGVVPDCECEAGEAAPAADGVSAVMDRNAERVIDATSERAARQIQQGKYEQAGETIVEGTVAAGILKGIGAGTRPRASATPDTEIDDAAAQADAAALAEQQKERELEAAAEASRLAFEKGRGDLLANMKGAGNATAVSMAPASSDALHLKSLGEDSKPDRWGPGGTCAGLLAENTASLRRAKEQADQQGWGFLHDATGIESAKKDAAAAAVDLAGARDLEATFDEARERLEQARRFDAFMKRVEGCVESDKEPVRCLVRLAGETGKDPAKAWLKGLLDRGTRDAAERAEKAAGLYRQYVQGLEETYQKQALSLSEGCAE